MGANPCARRPLPLPHPSQVSPPEPMPDRTRNVVGRVSISMMDAVTSHPGDGQSRAVEHGEECQYRAYPGMKMERPMGKRPVVAHCRADSADPAKAYGAQKDAPARQGKQNQARRGTQMDEHKPREHQPVTPGTAPQ